MQACFLSLVLLVQSKRPNFPVPADTDNSPFIVFDPSSYMCQFNADQQYFDEAIIDTTTTPAMRVYFNSPLMKLFRSFPARFLGHTNTPQNWQIKEIPTFIIF